jgi:ABC-type uncharacterized transport system involved in gliding motility auxiliary subunit
MAKQSARKDIDEILFYAVINARESVGEDWADELLDSCRRVYDRNVREEAIAEVDKQLRVFEKQLSENGKVLADRVGFRKGQIEAFVGAMKSFDEWMDGF